MAYLIMLKGKRSVKKILSALIAFFQISTLAFGVFALSAVDETELTTINALSYESAASSSGLIADPDNSSRLIINDGQYASYRLDIPKAGYYKLLVYGKHLGKKPEITIGVSAADMYYGLGVTATSDKRNTIGRFYFPVGENTIVLSVTGGGINISELLIKSVEHTIAGSGRTLIETHDYLQANIQTMYNEDAQWGYTATGAEFPIKGPVVTGTGLSIRRTCIYKLNVVSSGTYKLKAIAQSTCDAEFSLEIGGELYAEAFMEGTSSNLCQEAVFDTFNLISGAQEIEIKSRQTA